MLLKREQLTPINEQLKKKKKKRERGRERERERESRWRVAR